MRTFVLTLALFSVFTTLSAQSELSKIVIKGNQFYYQDNRLKTYEELQSVLQQSRDEQVLKDLERGKKLTNVGLTLGVVGLGAILVNSISNSSDPLNTNYTLAIAGIGVEVVGLGLVLAGKSKTRKAVERYNLGF